MFNIAFLSLVEENVYTIVFLDFLEDPVGNLPEGYTLLSEEDNTTFSIQINKKYTMNQIQYFVLNAIGTPIYLIGDFTKNLV